MHRRSPLCLQIGRRIESISTYRVFLCLQVDKIRLVKATSAVSSLSGVWWPEITFAKSDEFVSNHM